MVTPRRDDAQVTVIVPTYNGANVLGHTLDSLTAQTEPVEVIVIDDGSTDGTADIARAHDARPLVLTQPNLGVAVARNRGLALARTEWVAFLDQDDLWHRARVATLLDFADRRGADAVATTESRFAYARDRKALNAFADGRETWPEAWIEPGEESRLTASALPEATMREEELTLERFLEGAAMLTTSVMYRRELAISAGGCAPHARALDDHLLNVNVARIVGAIPRLDSRQLFYRVHSSSTTTVSPMAGPFLSSQAALRLGRVFPGEHRIGSNVHHLLFQLGRSDLATVDQLALLLLNVPRGQRWMWFRRWLVRRIGIR